MIKRYLLILLSVLTVLLLVALPVLALDNPTSIYFGVSSASRDMYRFFENVHENGDIFIIAESYVHYTVTQNESSEDAYSFQLIDHDGVTPLFTTGLPQYEGGLVGIYLTAAQVLSAGIVWSSNYTIRLTPNPSLLTPVEGTNQRSVTMIAGDTTKFYAENTTAESQVVLKVFLISIAKHLGQLDHASSSYYLTTVQGKRYLNDYGEELFFNCVPSLAVLCPDLFQTSVSTINLGSSNLSTTGGAFGSTVNITSSLGTTIAGGMAAFASWWHVSTTIAGIILLLLMTLVIGGYAYVKTQSPIIPDAILILMPIMGIGLGIIPMGIGFTITLFLALLSGYFFFSRGVL